MLLVFRIAAVRGDESQRPPRQEPSKQVFWQSPTSGKPLTYQFLSPRTQAIITWRVAVFMKHPQADKVLDALGPLGTWSRDTLPAIAGIPLDLIERLDVGFLTTESGLPPLSLVVRASTALSEKQLAQILKNPTKRMIAGQTIHIRDGRAYYLPSQIDQFTLVIAPESEIDDIVASDEKPLQLRRELEELRAASDSDRQFNLLSAPGYWTSGGKGLWGDQFELGRDWITWLFPPDARALLLSLNLDDALFLELRVFCSADQKPLLFARAFESRWSQLGPRAQTESAQRQLTPYNRAVLTRYPQMLKTLSFWTRGDTQGRQTILRAYLPAIAAHNLALGTRLFFEPLSR